MKKFIVLLLAVCLISVVPLLAKTADSEYIIELSEKSILVNGGAVSKSKSPVYLQNITETHPDVAEEYKNTANSVITISAEGTYRVKGSRENCQILIDAGENDRVRLILDGAEIRCKTAPAILVKSAYDPLKAGDAGVTIELAANSKNSVYGATGANNNGAVSSDVSVTLNGGGYLDITAENEGIETQKHLTVNGGIITINSADDAINASEDGISHIMINSGNISAFSSLGKEGDGIDSNGYITINGGTVLSSANPNSQDGGLDADLGVIINGGNVTSVGNMTSELSEQSKRRFITLNFAETQPGGSVITVKDSAGNEVASYTASPSQTFRSLSLSVPEIKDGTYTVYDGDGTQLKHSGQPQGGMGMMPRSFEPGEMPEMPEGFQPGEMPKMPEGFQPGQRPEMPEWFQPGQMPEMPEGFQPGQRPEMPGNFQPGQRPEMPEGFQPGQMPDFAEGSADQNPRKRDNAAANEASAEFIVSAESNTFNNVSPTEAEIQQ